MIIYFIENLNSEQCTNLFCEQLPLTGSEYNYPVQTPSPSSLCICSAVKSTDLDWVVPPFLQYIQYLRQQGNHFLNVVLEINFLLLNVLVLFISCLNKNFSFV